MGQKLFSAITTTLFEPFKKTIFARMNGARKGLESREAKPQFRQASSRFRGATLVVLLSAMKWSQRGFGALVQIVVAADVELSQKRFGQF